jgi:hypothetical protein
MTLFTWSNPGRVAQAIDNGDGIPVNTGDRLGISIFLPNPVRPYPSNALCS